VINNRLIVALDVETAAEAREIINELRSEVGAFKIGLQLFSAAGASFVREAAALGVKIFLDLKFHDIPNTVANAAIEVARMQIWMFNVHAIGGAEMMRHTVERVREICEQENLNQPKIIGVTVLTSSNQDTLRETGIETKINEQVVKLAKLSANSGLDGVVASPQEIQLIRKAVADEKFLIVTPGIRPSFATPDDQKRVMAPSQAVRAGSDYLVVGRPILQAQDRKTAARKILEEISF
jgi:orotidine-5'-phosphate decarboxylase